MEAVDQTPVVHTVKRQPKFMKYFRRHTESNLTIARAHSLSRYPDWYKTILAKWQPKLWMTTDL
ncbi:MAG TPA: hypothetical protein VEX68_26625 [Bryobacteraceae bacterium]|nr:hypothetical protein [Bryobacteraceae bacterium]